MTGTFHLFPTADASIPRLDGGSQQAVHQRGNEPTYRYPGNLRKRKRNQHPCHNSD